MGLADVGVRIEHVAVGRCDVHVAAYHRGLRTGRNALAAFDFAHGSLVLTEAGSKRRASLYVLSGEEALRAIDPGGIDVLATSLDGFRAALIAENRTLKRALTDPRIVSGIGNAYSDEILHAAQLSPIALTHKLQPAQWERLFTATRETQLPTAAAFGTLAVRDSLNNAQRIQAGRMWQRMHLWATTQGIAMQPLNQVVERAEREQTAGFEPEFTRAIAALVPDPAWHMVMPFRIGYPTQEAFLSPRRPAEEVVFEGH